MDPKVSAPWGNQTTKHVPVPLTRISGQGKPKCQMNDRTGARGRKTKPPPAVRYLRREGRALATHSPGARRRRRRELRVGTGPRGGRAPPQSTRPGAPAPSGRSARAAGKAGGRGRRRASHAVPGCGGRCQGRQGTLRCRPRPRDLRRRRERRGAGAERARRAP